MKNNDDNPDSEVASIVFSSVIKENLIDSVYFKSNRIVPLETNDHSLLSNIDRICTHDSKLFVFDRRMKKVVLFDMNGRYLAKIHRIGNGPGEYAGVMDFCLDTVRREIYVLCDRPYKIMRFNYDCELLGEEATKELFRNIVATPTDVYCNRVEGATGYIVDYEITRLDTKFNTVNNFLPLRTDIKNTLFRPGRTLTTTKNTCYTRRFDNSIYQLKDGKAIKKYMFDFREYALPGSCDISNSDDFTRTMYNNQYIYTITDVAESENFLMFNTNIGCFVLSKREQKLEGYKAIYNMELQIGNNAYYAVGNNDRMIAGAVRPETLHTFKDMAKKNKTPVKSQILKELIDNTEEDDNPILILYEFK